MYVPCILNSLLSRPTKVIYIYIYISRRIPWLSPVMRMDDKRTPNKILAWKPIGTRIRGRPRKRWVVGIEEDMQTI